MKIGIIAAMKPEIDIIINALDIEERINMFGATYYMGTTNENEVVLVECGVGKVNASVAATLLITQFGCEFIINTGIAGGTEPLNTKDVVLGTSLSYYDVDVRIFSYPYGQVPGLPLEYSTSLAYIVNVKSILNKLNIPFKEARIFSGDQFVTSKEQFKNVVLPTEGVAFEMEGCAVAQVCVKAGIDFVILRYISDIVGLESQVSDYQTFEQEMAERSAEICLKLINNLEEVSK